MPDHLRATFRVLDDQQRPLAIGKDLAALKAQVAPKARASLARAAAEIERTGLTTWDSAPCRARWRCSGGRTW